MSVPARRRQVAYSRERGLSVRRACTLFSVARSALRYQSRKATRDAPVIERMKALAAQYPRYGYRRIRIFLGRDGYRMSPGRAYRLWQASGSAGAAQAAEKARGCEPAAATGAIGAEPGVVLRLRIRPLRQRPAAQVPDRHRRVHQGGFGDRRRRPHSLAAGNRGAVALGQRARCADLPAQRQRSGVRVQERCLSWIVAQGIGTALIEPGKPWQNGVARKLQRQIPRRMPQPRMVPHARRSEGRSSRVGGGTTMPCGRIRASVISRRTSSPLNKQTQRLVKQRAGALRYSGPSRPGPLHHPPT